MNFFVKCQQQGQGEDIIQGMDAWKKASCLNWWIIYCRVHSLSNTCSCQQHMHFTPFLTLQNLNLEVLDLESRYSASNKAFEQCASMCNSKP
jgi:hypothetical protein